MVDSFLFLGLVNACFAGGVAFVAIAARACTGVVIAVLVVVMIIVAFGSPSL